MIFRSKSSIRPAFYVRLTDLPMKNKSKKYLSLRQHSLQIKRQRNLRMKHVEVIVTTVMTKFPDCHTLTPTQQSHKFYDRSFRFKEVRRFFKLKVNHFKYWCFRRLNPNSFAHVIYRNNGTWLIHKQSSKLHHYPLIFYVYFMTQFPALVECSK